MYFIPVCWSSLNRAKGLGEVNSTSCRGSLSSKGITVTQCIHPRGMLVCLSPLCLLWPRAVCVYLLLLGGGLLEGIEKCQGRQLFLTAGAWPWSFFSLRLLPSFIAACWIAPCPIVPRAHWPDLTKNCPLYQPHLPSVPPCPFYVSCDCKSPGVTRFCFSHCLLPCSLNDSNRYMEAGCGEKEIYILKGILRVSQIYVQGAIFRRLISCPLMWLCQWPVNELHSRAFK